jgi:hypothetical protein
MNVNQGQQQPQQGGGGPVQNVALPVIVKKSLSKWGMIGLDLSDSGFNKLHSKESKFSESHTKYNLEPEKFESYKETLIQKVNRMHALNCMSARDDSNDVCEVLREYTRLTRDNLEVAALERWPLTDPTFTSQEDADKFTDEQIKASTIGTYIHDSLTEAAQKQLKADQDFFEASDSDGNPYFDGACYFYAVADLVDPDNGQMIEKVRKQLRNLDVKDFGFSLIKMLSEFKNLKTRIGELGGTYDEDDQFLDFWECLKTMKEKEFARYVKQEKDIYRKLSRVNRGRIETYMRDMNNKEVAMKTDNEWNIMSPEDAMVMSLVNVIETMTKKSTKSTGDSKGTSKDDSKPSLSNEDKLKRKESKIPDWKKVAPKEDEPKEKANNDKTYYWCGKCRNGKGMWALHKESEHKFDFKSDNSKQGNGEKDKKKVSFAAAVTDGEEPNEVDGEPKIQVNKSLLTNAKAYLAQFQDFPDGGSSS